MPPHQVAASSPAGASGEVGELGALGEHVWIDVIQKMDEVYSDLLQYEVALEEKNAALEESQQFILSVLTSMSDILLVCNRSGILEDVNQSLQQFTGRSEGELRGTLLFDLFADEASRQSAMRLLTTPDAAHDLELQLRAADGSAMPVSFNCTPRYNSLGKMLGMVITGRPVGELRRAYQALRQAHDDLKRTQQQLLHSEKMASLGRLVAGVAHELNNPISFVLGNVHALRKYATRLHAYLDGVHQGRSHEELAALRQELRIDRVIDDLEPLIDGTIEGAERTRNIVDGLKRFSAVDREDSQPFNLTPCIERAVLWVAKAASERFQVRLDLAPEWTVIGSAGQMQQVMMNLVQNACDACAEQEAPLLTISGHVQPAGDGQGGEGGRREVVLEFHDNGPGIAPQHLSHIFDPFFTTKPVGKGTGLGLAISYTIVERHGGRIVVGNHPDGGALFTLYLPLAD
jgi:two-component system sensor histidine kinase HupT/HoxJ